MQEENQEVQVVEVINQEEIKKEDLTHNDEESVFESLDSTDEDVVENTTDENNTTVELDYLV